jgi:hypothetical protein
MLSAGDSLEIQTQKVRGWKKISYANRSQKRAGMATLISEKQT